MRELSERETEILTLTARGMSGPEIAADLGISTPTVRTTQRNIRMKLGAHTMVQAVAIALLNGTLPAMPVKVATRLGMGLPLLPGQEKGWTKVSVREAIEIEDRKRRLR